MVINAIQKELCFSCGACFSKCPSGAISMVEDEQGFLSPKVDYEKCTKCGLCVKSCPVYKTKRDDLTPIKDAYSVKSQHSSRCASGGAFTQLAGYYLNNGGYIAGAVWNKEFIPEIIVTNNCDDLLKIQSSKYVHASTGSSYKKTLELLELNKKVLYSATPCQIAGLYAFLGKDYDNLCTVEILCHAGGSPKAWKKYIEFANKKYNKKLADCKMQAAKDKVTLYFDDGEQIVESLYSENEYVELYMSGKTKKSSCTNCPFMGRIRNADFIIGDVWAKWAKQKRKDGISLLILNSDKSKKIFEEIKWDFVEPFDLDSEENAPLNKINNVIPIQNKDRVSVFEKLKENCDFEEIIANKKVALMNFNYPRDNYGALLLAYAIEQTVKKMGYEPYTINYYKNPMTMDFDPQGATWKFREKYLNLYGFYIDKNSLYKLNDVFKTFIFGSDVIWKQTREYVYFADWCTGLNRLIAYAASFSNKKMPRKDYYKKFCMRRFDKVSVREKSAIEICKQYAGIDAEQVIDPTLLLNKEDYQRIIDNEYSQIPQGDYVVYYTFWGINPYDIKLKLPIYNLFKDEFNKTRSFGQWLNLLKNSKCVITASFHGVCFALLYNKPFVYVRKPDEDNERIVSLFEKFGIKENCIVDSVEEITEDLAFRHIDWESINNKILEFKNYSLNWLKSALEIPLTYKKSNANATHYKFNILGIKVNLRKTKKIKFSCD